MIRPPYLILAVLLPLVAAAVTLAQPALVYEQPGDVQQALADAQSQGEEARKRAESLEAEAASATEAADRTAREAAGAAARIQEAEAAILADQARIGLVANVLDDLRYPVDAARLVKIADAVQQGEFHASDICKAGIALYLLKMIGVIDLLERLRLLVHKLDAMAADLKIAQLPGRDHLEYHGGLMR